MDFVFTRAFYFINILKNPYFCRVSIKGIIKKNKLFGIILPGYGNYEKNYSKIKNNKFKPHNNYFEIINNKGAENF